MDEFVIKFTNLLKYMPYIREEKVKSQRFLNCLPAPYKERVEFENMKTMDVVVRKDRMCYQQFKNRSDDSKPWENKDKNKVVMNMKSQRLSYLKIFGKDHWRKKLS